MNGPPGKRTGPEATNPEASSMSMLPGDDEASVTGLGDVPAGLRRRRSASYRLPAFDDAGHRDELDIIAESVNGLVPWAKFGLSEDQRRRHANVLVERYGWSVAEVEQVLGVQPKVAA